MPQVKPRANAGGSNDYSGADKMPKQIADAFGLHPDSLELLDSDEDATNVRACLSCEEWAKKYADLAAELAECRSDLEHCQYQIEQLLRINPTFADAGDLDSPLPP